MRFIQILTNYAEENMMTASETVRGWIHEVMKREGFVIKEPSLPQTSKTITKALNFKRTKLTFKSVSPLFPRLEE